MEDAVLFWQVDLEVYVISSKADSSEFEAESFQLSKGFFARVYVTLFEKTVVATLGWEHHGDPVVSRVVRKFFNTANAILTRHFFSRTPVKGGARSAARVLELFWRVIIEKTCYEGRFSGR